MAVSVVYTSGLFQQPATVSSWSFPLFQPYPALAVCQSRLVLAGFHLSFSLFRALELDFAQIPGPFQPLQFSPHLHISLYVSPLLGQNYAVPFQLKTTVEIQSP